MKLGWFCLLILAFSWVNPLFAKTISSEARHGMHGMLLFSDGEALYASHLPMFHAPHDVQLIIRFELGDNTVGSQLIKALDVGKPYWTLAPERFDLNRIGSSSQHGLWLFSADLYAGHFERKGKLTFASQAVLVKKVLIKNVLKTNKSNLTEFIRLTPDRAKRHFYARIIQGKPGVDQLFWLESKQTLPKQISIKTNKLTIETSDLAAKLGVSSENVHLYYQELGDLR